MRAAGENTPFLPGFALDRAIEISSDCAALRDAGILVSVVPSEFLRATMARLRPHIHAGQIILSATKGIEDGSCLRMTEVIADCLGGLDLPIGALSGPSFAYEVAQGQPTAVTVAFAQRGAATRIRHDFSSESLRIYTSTDVIGVELGGRSRT